MTQGLLQEKVRQAVPHIGYRLTVKLAEAGIIQSIWSPNFDGLTAKAASQSTLITAIDVGIDCQERLFRRPKRSEPHLCLPARRLRVRSVEDTTAELQQQEKFA